MGNTPDQKKISELVKQYQPRLLKISDASLVRIRISRERVLELTERAHKSFLPLVGELERELSQNRATQRKADFQKLQDLSLVFYGADMAFEEPLPVGHKARLKELIESVKEHDVHLFTWASALFRKDEESLKVLADIRGGKGYLDDAEDTIGLVKLYRKHWKEVKGKTPITESYLDKAESEATELLQLLKRTDTAIDSPASVRIRAYTLWAEAYTEIRDLGRYLARRTDNPSELFPGIFPGRSSSSKSEAKTPASATPNVSTSSSTEQTS